MNLYYDAPTNEAFEEMKKCAIELWNTYENSYGYATDKVSRIKDIGNIQDNFMYILAMFDQDNQIKIIKQLSQSTKEVVKERMIAGGNKESYIKMLGL